jgi:hypothetical protein
MSDDFDDLYGSKYLGAADLQGRQKRVKIIAVDIADLREKDGSTRRKYVLCFDGEDKVLPLNKTNALRLAQAFGKNRTGWTGQTIELYSEMTGLGKEGVRLRPLRKPAAAPAQSKQEEMSDEIPW